MFQPLFISIYFQLTEPATLLFEHPVDVKMFTDYLEYVHNPMDLSTIDMKVKQGGYVYAEGKIDTLSHLVDGLPNTNIITLKTLSKM
jgi:hypothetical protein